MRIGFDNSTGELTFVFSPDELTEGLKILEMFGWQGDKDVDLILQMTNAWIQAMEHKQ